MKMMYEVVYLINNYALPNAPLEERKQFFGSLAEISLHAKIISVTPFRVSQKDPLTDEEVAEVIRRNMKRMERMTKVRSSTNYPAPSRGMRKKRLSASEVLGDDDLPF